MHMTVEEKLRVSKETIAEFSRKWKITEFALFGSVLREDFRPDSDVDVLVTFSPDSDWGVEHLLDMKEELEALVGRAVDLVEKRLVEESRNYIRRKHILSHTWKPCMQRDDSLLLDMLQAARQILEYTNGLQEPDFLSSRRD
jgi:predicted nucleotidyltransferase